MVKIDLERAGIPYTTPDGVADFHAVGRHTHVTELFRNGVTLPEAQKLARHSDIKMTMKYAHIGIEDQAKAFAHLPNPCQHIGSISGIPEGHQQAPGVTERQSDQSADQIATPCEVALSGTDGQKKTPPDKGGVLWRRRESNEEVPSPNQSGTQEVTDSTLPLSVHCQHLDDASGHSLAPIDTCREQFFTTWDNLPDHIRLALEALGLDPMSHRDQSPGHCISNSTVHSDLAQLLLAWGHLSEQVRVEILSLVTSKSNAEHLPLSNEGGRQ